MGEVSSTGWQRRAAVAAGGGVGAGLRLLVAATLPAVGGFPTATLTVNLAGALFLGLALGWLLPMGRTRLTSMVCTGMLGALTTFSTFAVELVELVDAAPAVALGYATVSLTAGPLLARLGLRWSRGW